MFRVRVQGRKAEALPVAVYIVRRILYSIPVLLLVSFIIFCGVSYLGSPLFVLKQNPLTSKVTLAHIIAAKHLNDPVPLRYIYWLRDVFTDAFGTPLLNAHHAISSDLLRVIPHTLQLALSAEMVALMLGLGIGIYSAIRQYSIFDYAATTASFLGFAMPVFWLALMLQIGFTNLFLKWNVRLFYTSGLSTVPQPSGFHFLYDRVQHLAIPVMVVAVLSVAQYSRYMRASMLDVINSDYVRTARAKGLTEARVTMKHAFRNALIPIVTLSALNFGALIGGAIVTEQIFQLDGMGPYFFQNLTVQDSYPVMAWLMVVAVMIILFNLIADVLYGYLDPRVRYD
jgi:peptide/nickel transport system permease protein